MTIFYLGKDYQIYWKANLIILKQIQFSLESLNTRDYGVIEFDKRGKPKKIIEKPKKTLSKNIITGIYAFSNEVLELSKKLKKSSRGELEMSDLNNYFLKNNKLGGYPFRKRHCLV